MKVGDLVYAKHPKIVGCHELGMIVDREKLYKVGFRYLVLFPDIELTWIKFSDSLILLEDWIGEK